MSGIRRILLYIVLIIIVVCIIWAIAVSETTSKLYNKVIKSTG